MENKKRIFFISISVLLFGFVAQTPVASADDTNPPQITAFSITPIEFNTQSESQTLTLNVTLTDDSSGVCIAGDCGVYPVTPTYVTIAPFDGSSFLYPQMKIFLALTRLSGDDRNGTYAGMLEIPIYSKKGTWKVETVYLSDKAGNNVTLSAEQLLTLVPGATGVELTNTASIDDSTPPQITAFSITPTQFNTQSQNQTLTLNVTLTDDLSGVCVADDCDGQNFEPTNVYFESAIGFDQANFYWLERTSGNKNSGSYTASTEIVIGSKPGLWELEYIFLTDRVGNVAWLDARELLDQVPGAVGVTLANKASATSLEIEKDWIISSGNNYASFDDETLVTKQGGGSFVFADLVMEDYEIGSLPQQNLEGTPLGKIRLGIPSINLNFSKPVSISLYVGSEHNSKSLRVKSLNEGSTSWVNETSCVVSNGTCDFTTSHATYFAAVEKTATPSASPPSGNYFSPFAVTLSTTTPGASIYYTLDGSIPTSSSTLYTGPIGITQTRIVKAVAIKTGMASSEVMTAIYNLITEKIVNSLNPSVLLEDHSDGLISVEGEDPAATEKATFNVNYSLIASTMIVSIPKETEMTRTGGGLFNLTELIGLDRTSQINKSLGGYDSPRIIRFGIPNVSLDFSQPLIISLLVGSSYNGKTLNVYSQSEGSNSWDLLTTCVVSGNWCIFQAEHASYFSAGEKAPGAAVESVKKKKKPKPKRVLSVSPKKVKRGQIIIEAGKRFSKNNYVVCQFSKPGGGYYTPRVFRTDAKGSFAIYYKIPWDRPPGQYKWKCLDMKTKKSSKLSRFEVIW